MNASQRYPRLLCLTRKDTTESYGFTHIYNADFGHSVASMLPESIAAKTGLEEGDQIYEVNGNSVSQLNTKGLSAQINRNPYRTTVLVLKADLAKWYIDKKISINGQMKGIVRMITPLNNSHEEILDDGADLNGFASGLERETQNTNIETSLKTLTERVSAIENSTQRMMTLLKLIFDKISVLQGTVAETQQRFSVFHAEVQANVTEVVTQRKVVSRISGLHANAQNVGHKKETERPPQLK